MAYIICIFILLFSLKANTFQTEIGKCTLEIFQNKLQSNYDFENIIKNEINNLVKEFGYVQKQPFHIYITSNNSDFINKIDGPYPEWGIAIAKKNPDKIIIKSPRLANISIVKLKKILKHEINHIYMFRINEYYSIPSWFKEGFAMYTAKEFSLKHKILLSKAIYKNKIIPLSKLTKINHFPSHDISLAYAQSAAAIFALKNIYGKNIIKLIFSNFDNKKFNNALETSINISFLEYEVLYEKYLKDNYNWIFLIHISKYIYIILPLILIIGFLYIKFKNKTILKYWEMEEKFDKINVGDEELPN